MKYCRVKFREAIYEAYLEDQRVSITENVFFSEFRADRSLIGNSLSIDEVEFVLPVSPSKIICVGRNYQAHAAELGNDVPAEPLLFLKAPTSLILSGEQIVLPVQSDQVEHEGELALVIGKDCKNLSENANIDDYIFGFFCLNDVTARDIQNKDIQFTRAKSFDTFCPISKVIETDFDYGNRQISTSVNGILKQSGNIADMIFSVKDLLFYISKQMTLKCGDIISTGTPSGVSKLNRGDLCEIRIEGMDLLENKVF